MKHFFNFFLAAVMTAAFCGCSKPTPAKALSRVKDAAVAGNWRDAYNQCSKLEKSYPENEKVLLMLAVSAEKCSEIDRAIDAANRAYELNKTSFAAVYTLGRLYSNIPHRQSEALQLLLQARELSPQDQNVLILICNTAAATNHKNAISYLNDLSRSNKKLSGTVFNNISTVFAKNGKIDAAIKTFSIAEKVLANDPQVFLNSARFYDYWVKSPALAVSKYNHFIKLAGKRKEFRAAVAEASTRIKQLKRTTRR